jgi:hypothetical protein
MSKFQTWCQLRYFAHESRRSYGLEYQQLLDRCCNAKEMVVGGVADFYMEISVYADSCAGKLGAIRHARILKNRRPDQRQTCCYTSVSYSKFAKTTQYPGWPKNMNPMKNSVPAPVCTIIPTTFGASLKPEPTCRVT